MHHMNSPNYFSVICFLQALTAGAVASTAGSLSNVRWGAEGADLPLLSSGTLQQLEEGCVLLFRYMIKTLREKTAKEEEICFSWQFQRDRDHHRGEGMASGERAGLAVRKQRDHISHA